MKMASQQAALVGSAVLMLLGGSGVAQGGLGDPGAYLGHSPATIGGTLDLRFGHPSLPNRNMLLGVSGGYGPEIHPSLGLSFLSYSDPGYQVLAYVSDSSGEVSLSLAIPPDFSLWNATPLFAHVYVADPVALPAPGFGLTKTVRIQFETQDGWRRVGDLGIPRSLCTATSLARDQFDDETRVLVAGGGAGNIIVPQATATTELYNPMRRDFTPGPQMSTARTGHRAVLLSDGRVLITGGNNTAGVVTQTCEIFDPVTNSFTPTGMMNQARTAHAANVLNDGRVLVSGGFASYQNMPAAFVGNLNSALDTAEIWDPASGTWALTSTLMNSRRAGHQQLILPNGNVICIAGVIGGTSLNFNGVMTQIPLFTSSVDVFDPTTGLFAGIQSMNLARGFHGASVLSSGEVLVTGGFGPVGNSGSARSVSNCERLTSTGWVAAPPLPEAAGFHTQLASPSNQEAVIFGGFRTDLSALGATDSAARHWGGGAYSTIPIGQHPLDPAAMPSPVAGHQAVILYDGSFLVCGGSDSTTTSARAYIIVEN